ncbi:hypothetical protein AMTR_s00020p00057820 [Amborella trichopoda]|uniref:Uncharacterized protein n=1 Tax=Amborella trichopoda TaxID=13333 RepID=W1PVI9_AMBTC|nr:hypothetical protein AMTR_s00020p00057820 [Amborella trichopoda]
MCAGSCPSEPNSLTLAMAFYFLGAQARSRRRSGDCGSLSSRWVWEVLYDIHEDITMFIQEGFKVWNQGISDLNCATALLKPSFLRNKDNTALASSFSAVSRLNGTAVKYEDPIKLRFSCTCQTNLT